jgi:hypothetical protein
VISFLQNHHCDFLPLPYRLRQAQADSFLSC